MAFGRKRPPGRGQRKTTQPLTQPPVTVAKAILQSPRRSHGRLGDCGRNAHSARAGKRHGADTFQMTSLCGKAAACQRSRFIRIHAQNGFARLLQKATEVRNKARAGSAEGRKNARKEAQDGTASPTLEGIRRFMRLAFCPLVVRRSAALPCGKAAASLFRAAAREPGGVPPGSRAAGQPLPPNRRQRLCNSVQRERARVQWVSDSADSSALSSAVVR